MKKQFLLVLLAAVLFLPAVVPAQSNSMGWLASFNTIKLKKRFSLHAEAQLRSTDEWKQVQTLLLRTGLNYSLGKNLTVTAGYGFIDNRRIIAGVPGYATEHRIWEQLLVTQKVKFLSLSHRVRIEQRFIEKSRVVNNELEADGSVYANRFRYFIRGLAPFSGQTSFTKGPFAALQNEVFMNWGDNSGVNNEIFDQNRFYVAIGYRLHPSFDLETGYMNQYVNSAGKSFSNNHVVQLAGYLRL